MNDNIGLQKKRMSWGEFARISRNVWREHFERMESDHEYASWVQGGQIGPMPKKHK